MHTKQLTLLFLASMSFNLFGAEENTQAPLMKALIAALKMGPENETAVKLSMEIVSNMHRQNPASLNEIYNGSTPLAWAALYGNYPVVEFLCENGVKVNTRMRSKSTALHAAASNGCTKVIAKLLIHQANVKAQNIHNQTPLHRAIVSDKTDAAVMLIHAGSPLKRMDDYHNLPLDLAERKGMLRVAQLIYQKLNSPQTEPE